MHPIMVAEKKKLRPGRAGRHPPISSIYMEAARTI